MRSADRTDMLPNIDAIRTPQYCWKPYDPMCIRSQLPGGSQ